MTILQSALLTEIKLHNVDRNMPEFNKSIKFLEMGLYSNYNPYCADVVENCYNDPNLMLTRYYVKISFKPKHKYDDNIAVYQVNVYSDGHVMIYFHNTTYKAAE